VETEVAVIEVKVLRVTVVPVDVSLPLVTVAEVGIVLVPLVVLADTDVEDVLAVVLVNEAVDVWVLMVTVV
jgi:hypothetical protein